LANEVEGYYMFEWGQIMPVVGGERITQQTFGSTYLMHSPVTIEPASLKFLEVDENQELSFIPYVAGFQYEIIYNEGWNEWALDFVGWTNDTADRFYNTDNPFKGLVSMACLGAGSGYELQFVTQDSLTPKTLLVADYNSLSFEMWLMARILPDTYSFSVYFMNNDVVVSDVLPISLDYDLYDGTQPYTVEAWQHNELLLADFNFTDTEFNKVVFVTNHFTTGLPDYLGFYMDWIVLSKVEGMPLNGTSAFVYIAYASDASGTGFTTTFDAALDYIAVITTDTEIVTPVVGDFTGLWKNYKGETGAAASTKDWIEWEFGDFELGTAKDYVLDLKALVGYTIDSAVLQVDAGTLTVAIKIGTTAVTSLSAVAASTTITETAATAANTVAAGDKVILAVSTTYTGAPTLIRGKINLTRI